MKDVFTLVLSMVQSSLSPGLKKVFAFLGLTLAVLDPAFLGDPGKAESADCYGEISMRVV